MPAEMYGVERGSEIGGVLVGRVVPDAVTTSATFEGLTVRYLTPHNKWSIHSEYQDNLFMLSLSRGGPTMWMSPQDAAMAAPTPPLYCARSAALTSGCQSRWTTRSPLRLRGMHVHRCNAARR